MDNLARQYKARYRVVFSLLIHDEDCLGHRMTNLEQALDHALEGNPEIALSICWELRLEPQIGVYRRALVNLLIAKTLPAYRDSETMMFADECLDLIDLIRQDNGGTLDDDVKNIQSLAEDYIEELKEIEAQERKEREQAQTPTVGRVQGPDPGTLTSEANAPPRSPERPKATNDVDDADHEDKGKMIYVYRTTEDAIDGVVAERNNFFSIEGMLRDSTYEPRVKKA